MFRYAGFASSLSCCNGDSFAARSRSSIEKSKRELVALLGMYLSEYTIDRRGDENTADGDSRDLLRVSTLGDAVGVPGSDMVVEARAAGRAGSPVDDGGRREEAQTPISRR
jgi:hypothetical protein